MKRGSRRRGSAGLRTGRLSRLVALSACWALLLQTLIPLVHVPPAAGAEGAPSWALGALCHVELPSASGAGDRDHNSGKSAPGSSQPVCPICLGLHLAGTFTAPDAVILPLPSAAGAVGFSDRDHAGPSIFLRSPVQARAPPLLPA